jgi:photosystem II stability/assembly factor-like uncharacterized protein
MLRGISFIDANTGTAVGEGGMILHTTNGGANWINQMGNYGSLLGVCIIDASNGTIVGWDTYNHRGTILHTWTGGLRWELQSDSSMSTPLYGVFFTDLDTGTAVGGGPDSAGSMHGTILRTTNGGVTWSAQTSGTNATLRGVFFADANKGWAVGGERDSPSMQHGTILRTINGGATWTSQSSGTWNPLRAVSFGDAQHGVAVGDSGIILRTTDGGLTWARQVSGTSKNLCGVWFADSSTGTAVGDSGTILHTTTGGVTSVPGDPAAGGDRPDRILLEQNYPNPFNPTTVIRYQLPVGSEVRLVVYDMLGRKVSVLVDGRSEAGVHEVVFDASRYSSGVYYCRLQARGFTETKRLLLLK